VDSKQVGSDNIVVSPLGVDDETFYPIRTIAKDPNLIIFSGNMGYFPNQMAVLYFVQSIFPLIRKRKQDAEFWIVGGRASDTIKDLEKSNKAIRVLGFVDSMAEYINRASVSVSPMIAGSGMQFKILEALACGVPVVATSLAKGDIRLNEDDGLFVSDDATSFAETVVGIMEEKGLQDFVEEKAPQAIKENYSWERSNRMVENIYSKLQIERMCINA